MSPLLNTDIIIGGVVLTGVLLTSAYVIWPAVLVERKQNQDED